jgi:pilus assembly protein CpaB
MATIGRTLVRFAGALLLGAFATSIDHPGLLFAPNSRFDAVPVVIATRDIPEGVVIDRMAVMVVDWPVEATPPGRFTTVEALANRVTRVPIFRGEVILPDRLAPEGTPSRLEVRITPGKRAFSIRVTDAAGIAGMIQPNGRVDIMVIVNGETPGKRVARLFMSNMRVLAIGPLPDRAEGPRDIAAVVASIEVTPEEAERLAIAQTQGQIALVLRGNESRDSINAMAATGGAR